MKPETIKHTNRSPNFSDSLPCSIPEYCAKQLHNPLFLDLKPSTAPSLTARFGSNNLIAKSMKKARSCRHVAWIYTHTRFRTGSFSANGQLTDEAGRSGFNEAGYPAASHVDSSGNIVSVLFVGSCLSSNGRSKRVGKSL